MTINNIFTPCLVSPRFWEHYLDLDLDLIYINLNKTRKTLVYIAYSWPYKLMYDQL